MRSGCRRLTARLVVLALGAASLVALGAGSATGGPLPSGVFDVPAGTTVTFSNGVLDACNDLEWGYVIEGQSPVTVGSKPDECDTFPQSDTTIGPFAADVTLRLFLTDLFCGKTFYSDGTSESPSVDHAIVDGTDPVNVGIADAGGGCESADSDLMLEPGDGNLRVDVSIDPAVWIRKVVVGDDPGIAFPIHVACTADGAIPGSVGTSATPEIELGDPGTSDAVDVSLADGESAAIPLVFDSVYTDGATCTVSEDLAGVTLPTGFTCTASVDHPEVVWSDDQWTATPVTVTNTCIRAVEVEPAFTG